jgi:hypothetical protein
VAEARVVTSGEWSDDPETLATVLRDARRANHLPHRARVVAWDLSLRLAASRIQELDAFEAAGFAIEAVLSPAQALAQIVRDRAPAPGAEAVAALALNSQGMTIAIVSGAEILVSRSIEWPLGKPFSRRRSEQLERYLIVSQVAPHLRHMIDLVRAVYGVTVTSAIACGDLPDLRSVMMLLIDEIDLEVETLDSIDLLQPPEAGGRLDDAAAALQLASAAAVFVEPSVQPMGAPAGSAARSRFAPAVRRGSQALLAVAAVVLVVVWSALEVAGTSPATPAFPAGIETVAAIPPIPDLPTEATIGRTDERSRVGSSTPASPARPAHDEPRVPEPPRAYQEALTPRLRPTSDPTPLPEVSGIMIAGDRRLAIVGGVVVEPGDRVDERTILRIERDGVVFREPSGREVTVPIAKRDKG